MKKKSLHKGLLVSFMLLCAAHTWAYDFSVENDDGVTIYYNIITSKTCEVTSYSVYSNNRYAYSGCVVIPLSVMYNGVTFDVISIGDDAFARCYDLTGVTIPNSVTSIGEGAFEGCSSLAEITIPNSVTRIGDYAFYGCSSLKELYVPDSVTNFGERVLVGCNNLESLSIGVGLTELCEYYSFSANSWQNLSSLTYRPLLWTDGPNQMKNIILRDDTSSFATKGYYYYYRYSSTEDGAIQYFQTLM